MRSYLTAIAALSLALAACTSDVDPGGPDIFQLAVDEAPGGALLSVWVSPDSDVAYLVGGYVGVPPEAVPGGMLGRLVRYENGAFETICTTPRVLWWVQGGLDGVVASGDDGTVVRYRDGGACEVTQVDGDWPAGRPTLWGLFGTAANDVRFVGGAVESAGPKGVILHWDGAGYAREVVPPDAATLNLFKITRALDRAYVVGEGGAILELVDGGSAWSRVASPSLGADSTLFTVSCARSGAVCAAVGGRSRGSILFRSGFSWSHNEELSLLPGLNGVYVEHDASIFAVGQYGETLHFNGVTFYEPSVPITSNPLHGVAGNGSLFLAVGGEIGNPTADQRATILVRGANRAEYTLDGSTFRASGSVRPRLGDGRGQ